MYHEKLVASVKANGKVLREQGSDVFLPFGQEYSLLLKNLNTRKAQVNIEIDGEDVLGGRSLLLGANEDIDLRRFIVDGNLDEGPTFKFVEKTSEISDSRGDKAADGLIRITYQFEQQYQPYGNWIWNDRNRTVYGGPSTTGLTRGSSSLYASNIRVGGSIGASTFSSSECHDCVACAASAEQEVYTSGNIINQANDSGFTVKGQEVSQKFKQGSICVLEVTEHVIILQLRGNVNQKPVNAPLTVKRKLVCSSCQKSNDSIAKFCSRCGNNLKY